MKALLLAFFAVFAVAAQTDLPDKGSLSELSGKTKYYVIADGLAPKYIRGAFKKSKTLVEVNSADDAEFFVEYRTIKEADPGSGLAAMLSTEGQMDIFYRRGDKKVIVWTDVDVGGLPVRSLARKAVKALDGNTK
jgi:hypothetical protein